MTVAEPGFAGAPEVLARLGQETKRLTFEWGQAPVGPGGAEHTAWTQFHGKWAIAHGWLISLAERKVNRGFRLTVAETWLLELWQEGSRMTYTSAQPLSPRTITRLINATFGLCGTGEEDGI